MARIKKPGVMGTPGSTLSEDNTAKLDRGGATIESASKNVKSVLLLRTYHALNKFRNSRFKHRQRFGMDIHHVAGIEIFHLDPVFESGQNVPRWSTVYSVAKNGVARSKYPFRTRTFRYGSFAMTSARSSDTSGIPHPPIGPASPVSNPT